MVSLRIIVVVLLVAAGGFPTGGHADQIRWKFKSGDRYEIKLNQTSVLKTGVNRTDVRVELVLGCEMNWEVLSVKPNGNALIKQSFTRMNVKVAKTAKPTIRYDTASSEDPADNARYFAEVYDQLVGIEFQVEMSDLGEVVNVNLDKKDLETIRRIPESMQARQLFEKRGLVELLNGGGFLLPDKDLKKGEQWPVTKKQKLSFGTAELESRFTYQGTEAETATFVLKGTTRLKDQPKNPLENPLVLKSQEQSGVLRFNVNGGHLDSIEITQQLVTEKPFREMTINTSSTVDNRLTVVKR